MTMKMLTILQFSEIFLVYIIVTTWLPSLVLRSVLLERKLSEKFLISFLAGNFYIMNLVYFLQILKISNRYTLIIFSVIPAIFMGVKINHIKFKPALALAYKNMKRLSEGKYGFKNLILEIFSWIAEQIKVLLSRLAGTLLKHNIEWIFLVGVLLCVAYMYGKPILVGYGYSASDSPVHLYWINGMEHNNIFIDGVYPFGYHNVIYYLHAVFNIDAYIFMRVFGFVQAIMLHMVLLAFLKLCCKSRFVGYGVVSFYTLTEVLQSSTYLRFCAVLPQEYGMMFILPAIYFGFEFFKNRRRQLAKCQTENEGLLCLIMFAMSFSMTLTVHFYDTMIAGLFCVGIAVGYVFWFLNKKYFWNIVCTCFLSVMIAVLPMVTAFAMGTPLQGSLGWGMSVINGDSDKTEAGTTEEGEEIDDLDGTVQYYDKDGNLMHVGKADSHVVKPNQSIADKFVTAWNHICDGIQNSLFTNPKSWFFKAVLGMIGLLYLLGVLFLLRKESMYGSMLVSTAVFMSLMSILQSAKLLGVPELMDGKRCRIYYAYMLAVTLAFCVDGVIQFVFIYKKLGLLRDLCSLAFVVLVIWYLSNPANIKPEVDDTRLVTNEAITCLTNILHDEKDFTWTIVSANDELQMAINHGYHYELNSFLNEMENRNGGIAVRSTPGENQDPVIKIPTPSVYIFVEKIPLDYAVGYENSGQTISEEGAKRFLPYCGGIGMYQGENRWILMSRIYYWAKEFKRLHPNEVTEYFENEKFVCYKVEQNAYRLFDFAIDYKYNYPIEE